MLPCFLGLRIKIAGSILPMKLAIYCVPNFVAKSNGLKPIQKTTHAREVAILGCPIWRKTYLLYIVRFRCWPLRTKNLGTWCQAGPSQARDYNRQDSLRVTSYKCNKITQLQTIETYVQHHQFEWLWHVVTISRVLYDVNSEQTTNETWENWTCHTSIFEFART